MRSSAGWGSPQLRASACTAGIAVAALALSLFLAFAAQNAPRAYVRVVAPRLHIARIARIALPAHLVPRNEHPAPQRRTLWSLLAPWAVAVDALALAGLAAVFAVRVRR